MGRRMFDMTNHVYGRLVVLGFGFRKQGMLYWKCQCDCGAITFIEGRCLRSGNTKSCGCSKMFSAHSRKLDPSEVKKLIRERKAGANVKALAFKYGISSSHVYTIVRRESWKYLDV